jgi:hypothetical protein
VVCVTVTWQECGSDVVRVAVCTHLDDDQLDPLHVLLDLAVARDVVRVAVMWQ